MTSVQMRNQKTIRKTEKRQIYCYCRIYKQIRTDFTNAGNVTMLETFKINKTQTGRPRSHGAKRNKSNVVRRQKCTNKGRR